MPVAPSYDVQKAVDTLFQGLVTQANLLLAATERTEAKGAPLEPSDVAPILARANILLAAEPVPPVRYPTSQPPYPLTLPPYPRRLPRWFRCRR